MEVDLVMLRSKFYLRLSDAAKSFGISVTSLKQVCRKLGFKRCPRSLTPRKAHRIHASCSSSGGSSTDLRSTPPDCGSCDEDDELYDSSKRHRAELRSRSSAETRLSLSTDGSSSCSTSRSSQSKRKRSAGPAHSKRRGSDRSQASSNRDDTSAFLDAHFVHCSLPTPAIAPPTLASFQISRDPAQQLGQQTPAPHHSIAAASSECSGATICHASWGANAYRSVAQDGFATTACFSLQPNAPFSSFSAKSTSTMMGPARADAHMGLHQFDSPPVNAKAHHPLLFHAATGDASLKNEYNKRKGSFASLRGPTTCGKFLLATLSAGGNQHFTNQDPTQSLNVGKCGAKSQGPEYESRFKGRSRVDHGSVNGHGSVNSVDSDKKLDAQTMKVHLASLQALQQQTQFPSLCTLISEVYAR